MAGRKHTDAEIADRRAWLEQSLRGGMVWGPTLRKQYADRYNIGRRQAERDLRHVLRKHREAVEEARKEAGWTAADDAFVMIEDIRELRLRAVGMGRIDWALKAAAMEASLLGLDQPQRIELSGPKSQPIEIVAPDALREEARQARARIAELRRVAAQTATEDPVIIVGGEPGEAK